MTECQGGRSLLIYGPSGSFKTTNAGFFAKYIYEQYGLKTLMITADGGGWQPIQPLLDLGVIEVYNLINHSSPTTAMARLVQGYWPVVDSKGVLKKTVDWRKIDFVAEGVGAYIFEVMTTWADLIMRSMSKKGPTMGEQTSFSFIEEALSPNKFFGLNRAYYGFTQSRMHDYVLAASALPVKRVLWTAHEADATDDGESITGPAIAGKAATPKVPSWVGECIHFQLNTEVEREVQGVKMARFKQKVLGTRGYFVNHPDYTTGRTHRCKPRIPSAQIPALMDKYKEGYVPLNIDSGLDDFLRTEDRLMVQEISQLSDWKKRADAKLTQHTKE